MPARSLFPSCLAGVVLGLCTLATHAAPPNDNCASAQVVTVSGLNVFVTVPGNSAGATSNIAQTCGTNDELDVWYTFTAPATGMWTFDTIASVLFDTTLAVYSSCGGTLLSCNDDIDGPNGYYWSAVTLNMTAGQTVKIRIAANNGDADTFVLNVVGTAAFTNDTCANATPIQLNQPLGGTTIAATTDLTLPSSACGSFPGSRGGRDVFYSFIPPTTAPYHISLCSSNFDTTLAVLTNCSGTAASVVICDDDAICSTGVTKSDIPAIGLSAGVRYIIRVAGFDFDPPDFGSYTLSVTANTFGVCCRGATCSLLIPSQCVPSGGRSGLVFGAATGCNAPGVTSTPCCYPDYNKVNGITVQDIFDYLSDWFEGNYVTTVGGPGNTSPTVQDIFRFLNAWFAGC